MTRMQVLTTTFPLLLVSFALADVAPPIVELGYATYQGVFNSTSNTTNFFGIRFAAPPVGEL